MVRRVIGYGGLLLVAAALAVSRPAAAELPLLEKYTLETVSSNRRTAYRLQDASLGGGDAQSQIRFDRYRTAGTLQLRVWRRVRPGHTSFALLGERVEVRGYDLSGTVVFTRDYDGLTRDGIYFGDSRSGDWRRVMRAIPLAVTKIEVTFLGNYE